MPRDLRGRASTRLRDMFRLGFWFYSVESICSVVYMKRGGWSFEEKKKKRHRESNGWRRKLRDSLKIENFREVWGQVLFWGDVSLVILAISKAEFYKCWPMTYQSHANRFVQILDYSDTEFYISTRLHWDRVVLGRGSEKRHTVLGYPIIE